jgi:hypothetical protein
VSTNDNHQDASFRPSEDWTTDDYRNRSLRLVEQIKTYIETVAQPRFGNSYVPDRRLAEFWRQAGYVAPTGVGAFGKENHWLRAIGRGPNRVWVLDQAALEWYARNMAEGRMIWVGRGAP